FALRKTLEKALLESGHKLSCSQGSVALFPKVESLKETPIAYSPQQRVSAYSLEMTVRVKAGTQDMTFSAVVPYSQPTGGVGDLPRRRAIEDAFGIIYLDMVENFKRRFGHVHNP
ncbi:MAG: hypothetical protein D6699_00630, partial [Aquificota bacterium]